MGVLRIFYPLLRTFHLHKKLVYFGRRDRVFFARCKTPQARKQSSCKSRQGGSISGGNVKAIRFEALIGDLGGRRPVT